MSILQEGAARLRWNARLREKFSAQLKGWLCNFGQLLELNFAKSHTSKDLTYHVTGVRPDCALRFDFSLLELRDHV